MPIPNLISIIMPAYNVEHYISACIDSIREQTEDNWELIVVDDQSTDDTLNIIEQYAHKDQRIKVIRNKEKGIIPALQLGYAQANGKFITRMDSDDLMSSEKLFSLKNSLSSAPEGKVATAYVKYFSDTSLGNGYIKYEKWLNKLIDDDNHWKNIYKECVIPSPCWMMTRETFEKIGAFSSNIYPEDYELVFRMKEHHLKVVHTPKVLHLWRDYPDRTSRTDEHYSDNRFLGLKTSYFIKLDYNPQRPLVLCGAGKKGKMIAKILLDNKLNFQWITNNPNKIGHDIYGIILNESLKEKSRNAQIIVAIANENEKKQINKTLSLLEECDIYKFC